MSERYIPKYLIDDLDKYLKSFEYHESKKIQTNGNIVSYLQDVDGYVHTMEMKLFTSSIPYKIGTLKDVDIYIDPYQRWDDNKIYFFDENGDKIASVDIDFRHYEELSSNEDRSNKLKILLDDDDVELTKKFNEEQERLEISRRKANLDKIFRELVFKLLEDHPEIKKIKTTSNVCSNLDLYEIRQLTDKISTISFKLGHFRGKEIAEYTKKIFDGKLILYLETHSQPPEILDLYPDINNESDEILFLDENDNEIYKINMNSI